MVLKHFRCLRMQKVFFLQMFTSLCVQMKHMLPLERGMVVNKFASSDLYAYI